MKNPTKFQIHYLRLIHIYHWPTWFTLSILLLVLPATYIQAQSPAGLYAIAQDGKVELTWNAVTDPAFLKYNIYQGTSPNPTTIIGTTNSISETSFTATGLTNGTQYYFRVKSEDNVGNLSDFSNEDSAVPVLKAGNALRFDGGFDNCYIADNNLLDLTTTYTLEAWINLESYSWLAGIISKYQTNSANGYFLRLSNFAPYDEISFDGMETSGLDLLLNTWYHIAAVNNNGNRKLYVNGSEVLLNGNADFTFPSANTDQLKIGSDFNSRYIIGKIDEVRIWNVARTINEIKDNYLKPLRGDEAGLVVLYHCDEAVGQSITYDGSVNNFNASLYNNTTFVTSGAMATAPPIGLYAIAQDEKVELTWNAVTDPAFLKYNIYQGTSTNPTTIVGSTNSISETSFTVTGLTNGTQYFFRVKSEDNVGNLSGFSNEDAAVPVIKAGNALSFNGTNSVVQLSSTPTALNLTSSFTMEAWFFANSLTGVQRIFTKPFAYSFGLDNGLLLFTTFGIRDYRVTPTGLTAGTWHHLAVVFDESYDAYFYLDGQFQGFSAGSLPANVSNFTCVIGSQGGGPPQFFNGRIDEVRIWNVKRTLAEINASISKPLRGDEVGLVALYHCDEAVGQSFTYDGSVNNFNAFLFNSATFVTSGAMAIPPTGLFAIAQDGKVELSWNAVNDPAFLKYNIYQGTSTNPTTIVGSTNSISETSFTVTGLTNGTLYFFRVNSEDNAGILSGYSNEDAAVPVLGDGNALEFDGADDNVILPSIGTLTTNTLTMECWIKPNGNQLGSAGLIFRRDGGNATGLNIASQNSSKIGYHWNDNPSTYNWTGGPTYNPNVWNHVALVIEPTKATIYLNGVPYVNNVANAAISLGGPSSFIKLGKDNTSGNRHFKGTMDEVRIWNVARTKDEILAAMIDDLTGSESGIVGVWHLDEPSGNVAYNGSAVSVDGTLQGGPLHVLSERSANILSFSLPEQRGVTHIDQSTHTVELEVEAGTDVTALIPSFTLSTGATGKVGVVMQVSGTTPNNFTTPLNYTINGANGSVIVWAVTVNIHVPSPTEITSFSFAKQTGPATLISNIFDIGLTQNNTSSFLDLVSYNNGTHYLGKIELNSMVNQADFKNLEIRFGQGTQKAYRFTVPSGSGPGVPDANYTYRDYVDVPFQVWDVDNNKQLMVSFRDQQNDGKFTLKELNDVPGDELYHSREYIFIHTMDYAVTANPNIAVSGGQMYNNMYFLWPFLPTGGIFDPANLPVSNLAIEVANSSVGIEVSSEATINSLIPTITLKSGSTVSPSSGVANDFVEPRIYKVTSPDGTSSEKWLVTVTVAAGPPNILSFTPVSGSVGSVVTITGTNFNAADGIVKFNNTQGLVLGRTGTSITTTVPTGASSGKISMCSSDLEGSYNYSTIVTAAPGGNLSGCLGGVTGTGELKKLSDAYGTYLISDASFGEFGCARGLVPAAGIRLISNCESFSFGSTDQYGNSYSISNVIISSDGKGLSFNWQTTNGDAGTTTLTRSDSKDWFAMVGMSSTDFTVNVPPVITSFTPSSGPIGTTVVISGTNFSPNVSNNIVFFGATQASVTAASATQLTVKVPLGATYMPITVLVNELLAYSKEPFTVTFNGSAITSNSFASDNPLTSGAGPFSVAIGDLDGDGKADLAVANVDNATLSIFRNNSGVGEAISYAAKIDYTTAAKPNFISIGDLDGDGKADLVLVHNGGTVSVFRNTSVGQGTISYSTKVDYPAGAYPYSVAIGDLDMDGKADLVVVDYDNATVSVLRNTSTKAGTISFAAGVNFTTGLGPISVAIGDLNEDGKADIAVANFDSDNVSVFRNTGTGAGTISFDTKVDYATGIDSRSVAIGDLDGDHKSDLAVVNVSSSTVSVFRNTSINAGSISYASKVDLAVGTQPRQVAMSDLDGDGKIDLAISMTGGQLSLLRNTSTGPGNIGYAAKIDFVTGLNPRQVSIGDLNNDGKNDLVVANYGGTTISVFRNIINPIQEEIVSGLEQPISHSINIYPNPARDEIIIDLAAFEIDKEVMISIKDIFGKPISKTIGRGGQTIHMNIQGYSSGPYLLLLQQGQTVVYKRFIKSL